MWKTVFLVVTKIALFVSIIFHVILLKSFKEIASKCVQIFITIFRLKLLRVFISIACNISGIIFIIKHIT